MIYSETVRFNDTDYDCELSYNGAWTFKLTGDYHVPFVGIGHDVKTAVRNFFDVLYGHNLGVAIKEKEEIDNELKEEFNYNYNLSKHIVENFNPVPIEMELPMKDVMYKFNDGSGE